MGKGMVECLENKHRKIVASRVYEKRGLEGMTVAIYINNGTVMGVEYRGKILKLPAAMQELSQVEGPTHAHRQFIMIRIIINTQNCTHVCILQIPDTP